MVENVPSTVKRALIKPDGGLSSHDGALSSHDGAAPSVNSLPPTVESEKVANFLATSCPATL